MIHSTLLALHMQRSVDHRHVALVPHLSSILSVSSFTLLAFLSIIVLLAPRLDVTILDSILIQLLISFNSLLVLGFLAFPEVAICLFAVPTLLVIAV